jgi:hypothetical protein
MLRKKLFDSGLEFSRLLIKKWLNAGCIWITEGVLENLTSIVFIFGLDPTFKIGSDLHLKFLELVNVFHLEIALQRLHARLTGTTLVF